MQDEGVVKHIKAENGFGFIKLASGPDIFFHCSDVDRTLVFDERLVGQRVVFSVEQSPRGPKAVGVRLWRA